MLVCFVGEQALGKSPNFASLKPVVRYIMAACISGCYFPYVCPVPFRYNARPVFTSEGGWLHRESYKMVALCYPETYPHATSVHV